jgi:uncharacterized protein (DUF433 family)
VRLDGLRRAHTYLRKTFQAEYPFAQLAVKTGGVSVLAEYVGYEGGRTLRGLLAPDHDSQWEWPEAIQQRFGQFDYEGGRAVRWYPRGRANPIIVDPRIAFGVPIIEPAGIATWVIRERYGAGESLPEIEEDFGVTREQVAAALAFEGVAVHAA